MNLFAQPKTRNIERLSSDRMFVELKNTCPGATDAEIYDLLITSGHDLNKARRLAAEADEMAMHLSDYLALFSGDKR
jgi:hypothetical protein